MDQATDPVTGRPAAPPVDMTRGSRDPEAIADDIRETRAEMDETIDALSAKLDPANLVDQAKEVFSSSARDAGTSMMESFKDSSFLDTIKENPVPAAAVGLSVAWFLSKMGEAESDRYRDERYRATGDPYYAPRPRVRYGTSPRYAMYDDRAYGGPYDDRDPYDARRFGGASDDESMADKASGALDTVKDKASDAVDAVKDKAGDLADSARDAVSGSADATRDQAHRARQQAGRYERQAASWLDRQMTANPLAVGAVALAAGALVGLSVPETDAEHRAFGDQADDVKRQLADVASDKVDTVKGAAQDVAQQAKDKASEVADEAADKGKDVADHASSRAKDVAGEAEDKAKQVSDKAASSGSTGSTPGSPSMAGSSTGGSAPGSSTGSTSGPTTGPGSTTGGSSSGTPS